jgi:hypothetical protein
MESGTARRSPLSGENLMKEKLEDARDMVAAIIDRGRSYPVGLVRVHLLLEQMLADWWDEDDTASIPIWFEDEQVGEPNPEPPFPAA